MFLEYKLNEMKNVMYGWASTDFTYICNDRTTFGFKAIEEDIYVMLQLQSSGLECKTII